MNKLLWVTNCLLFFHIYAWRPVSTFQSDGSEYNVSLDMDRAQISVGKNGSAVFYLNAKNVHVEPQNSDFILIELYMILSNMILIIHLDNNQETCRIYGRKWLGCLWTFFLEQGWSIRWQTNWLIENIFLLAQEHQSFWSHRNSIYYQRLSHLLVERS